MARVKGAFPTSGTIAYMSRSDHVPRHTIVVFIRRLLVYHLDKLRARADIIGAHAGLNPPNSGQALSISFAVMAEPRPILPLVNEETARLKWFEAFMGRRCLLLCCPHCAVPTKPITRVELEQETYADSNIVHGPVTDVPESISRLQALLEGAPPLPERKLLWHCALEKLLYGTREGLNPILCD